MNKLYDKKVGNNIRTIRMEQGYNQEQIAAKLQLQGCDISRSSLAKIESGYRHIHPDEIIAFCNIFNVSPNEILTEITFSEDLTANE